MLHKYYARYASLSLSVRNASKVDIVMELAHAGAFASNGSKYGYWLPNSKELTELIQDGFVSQSNSHHLVELTDRSQDLLVPVLSLKQKAKLNKYFRTQQIDDMSTLELIATLRGLGWDSVSKAPGSRIAPCTQKRCRKAWFCTVASSKVVSKWYLICCAEVGSLFESGLEELHHMQPDAYYKAIQFFKSDSDKLKKVVPYKPATFYFELMGQKQHRNGEPSKEVDEDNDFVSVLERIANQQDEDDRLQQDEIIQLDRPDQEVGMSGGPQYRRLYIRTQDLHLFGFTPGCSACGAIERGNVRTGVHHTAECRERIMKSLETTDEGKHRLKQLEEREKEFVEQVQAMQADEHANAVLDRDLKRCKRS